LDHHIVIIDVTVDDLVGERFQFRYRILIPFQDIDDDLFLPSISDALDVCTNGIARISEVPDQISVGAVLIK